MLFDPVPTRVLVFIPNRFLADAVCDELAQGGPFMAQACDTDLLSQLATFRPDIIVVDPAHLPGSLNGWRAAMVQRLPECQILAYVGQNGRSVAATCLAAGLDGVVSQGKGIDTFIEALTTLRSGGVYLDHDLSTRAGRNSAGADEAELSHGLSDRERSVLEYVARGFSNKEIAAKLSLSAKTVETYRSRASGKLGFRRKSDIVQFALRNNWLTDRAYAM